MKMVGRLLLFAIMVLAVCILVVRGRELDAYRAPMNTPGTTIAPSPTPIALDGPFELPIQGATGYTTITMNLREAPSVESARLQRLAPGTAFQIGEEHGAYWRVTGDGFAGYVAHRYCMINLPDVLPSIVYDDTNSYASRIRTSGKAIPGVTGEALYKNATYNARLGQTEFVMPVLYEMAKKIGVAQKAALADGNSLIIYEAYRPYAAQRAVVDALNVLAQTDAQVKSGISTSPWRVSWFASQRISNHQRGCAIDTSLVSVTQVQTRICGAYSYTEVVDFAEYAMPTAMHELSIAAAAFEAPVASTSKTAWRQANPADSMNGAARTLQMYCTQAGLTPLASEWWHFNDLDAYEGIKNNAGNGATTLNIVLSTPPDA